MTTPELEGTPEALGEADPTWGFLARIRRLVQVYGAAWSAEVSSEVTAVQFGALAGLHRDPGQDQKTLAARLSMDKATAADVVKRMTQRGLVQVLRDPHDSRRKVLILTDEGREVVHRIAPRVDRLRRDVFGTLAPAEQKAFVETIDRLVLQIETRMEARP
ncbi:MarR family winged helix-turn-helix transcriptional regulator [Streptomyces sp. NPDC052043]|uniref:MarR family winged helix-turn-helix transcriptional regulator n=1 Tax=Streptomyces sp. NPDC052043 TaxID=3365684 RepID=UPI0037D5C33D